MIVAYLTLPGLNNFLIFLTSSLIIFAIYPRVMAYLRLGISFLKSNYTYRYFSYSVNALIHSA